MNKNITILILKIHFPTNVIFVYLAKPTNDLQF